MALNPCPHCFYMIDEKLKICPRCKKKIKDRFSQTVNIIFLLLIVAGIIYLLSTNAKNEQILKTAKRSESHESEKTKSLSLDAEKTQQIAAYIQNKTNIKGYDGCRAFMIRPGLVECELHFPLSASDATIEINVRGAANLWCSLGVAASIYVDGWRGNQRVCCYKYSVHTLSVSKEKF